MTRRRRTWACRPTTRRCHRCSRRRATARPGRQMASRLSAGLQPAQERLRPLLRIFGGAADYFNHGPQSSAPLTRRGAGRAHRLHDEPARRSGGADHRRLREVEGAVPAEPAFHRAALAVGGPGRRGRVEASSAITCGTTMAARRRPTRPWCKAWTPISAACCRRSTHGLASNTIVIFTSDNGGERFSKTWPFSGMKTELLEGGIRIPAIVRGRARAGRDTPSRS